MRPQPLLAVLDVEASSRWYQRLLGCRSDHGGPEYERLVDGDRLVLQLHSLEIDHDHGRIGDPTHVRGNGVLLWFEVDDFDAAVARSGELDAEVVLPVHRNPPAAGSTTHRCATCQSLEYFPPTRARSGPVRFDPHWNGWS